MIDPGEEPARILRLLQQEELTARLILHTHAHLDHVGGSAEVARVTGAPILLHKADAPLWEWVPQQAATFGFVCPPMRSVDRYVQDGETLTWGSCSGEVLHTPGHSPGGLCLLVRGAGAGGRDLLFSGDTLFAESVGRTDLWGGSSEQLMQSIRDRILTLSDETEVIPGHGPATTVGHERSENPFLTGQEDWI